MNTTNPRNLTTLMIGLAVGFAATAPVVAQVADRTAGDPATNWEWPSYGADLASSKYAPLAQIHGENFDRLEVAWSWDSADEAILESTDDRTRFRRIGFKATPVMVDGILYLPTALGQIAAVDARSGRTVWIHDPKSYELGAPANVTGFHHRGVAHWRGTDQQRIFAGTHDGHLIALDAATGEPAAEFGDGGRVDLMTAVPRVDRSSTKVLHGGERFHLSVDSPPIVCRDVVIVGSSLSDRPPDKEWPPGYVQAFSARTGERLWDFHIVPQEGDFGTETWENESWRYSGNANVWTMMSADDDLGYVYLPTSTPTSDYYGVFRPGDNLFAESLVCVDVTSGQRVWHFQMVHHGLWDWDLPAAPNLIDVVVDGKPIKAVAQVSKQGWCYVFDRVTGKPIWPIEERPVPQSDIPGERAAPTQPHPTKPPAFEYQGVDIDQLIDFTPELRQEAIEEVSHYRIGPMFTPPSLYERGGTRGTIQLPGAGGGANWSGAAVDPETGILYVPSRTYPTMVVLARIRPSVGNLKYVRSGTVGPSSYHRDRPQRPRGPRGLPLIKPPYSRMTAINLNSGDQQWMVPTGRGFERIRNHPDLAGLDLPPLGGQGRGGPLLTKSILVHSLMLDDNGGALIAYDKHDGRVLAQKELPGRTIGAPMTYMIDGRQYIAVTVRSGRAGQLIALSLPQ